MSTRKGRGRDSELRLAEWLQAHGWPDAVANAANRPGLDILGVHGWGVEVKARTRLDLPAWLRQAHRQAGQARPLLIVRSNGQGTADIGSWAAVQRLDQWVEGQQQ